MTYREIRITLLGAGAVGKTSMLFAWQTNHTMFFLPSEYDPTVAEESYRKQLVVDGCAHMLNLVDTAGQAEWSAPRDQVCDGYVLVFDYTNRSSFDELKSIIADIVALRSLHAITDVPIVLVGNKCEAEDLRAVASLEAEEFASAIGAPFLECSAKQRLNLDAVFLEAVRQIVARQLPAPATTASRGNSKLASKLKRLFRIKRA
jgi:GTPase KRas protein